MNVIILVQITNSLQYLHIEQDIIISLSEFHSSGKNLQKMIQQQQ